MTDAPHVAVLRAGLARVSALRADLECELAAIAGSTAAIPDDEHDPEGSTVGYERARVATLLAAVRREADDLAGALARATGEDAGTGCPYGCCRACGATIEPERLAALPAAVICVACATPAAPARFRLVR